MADPVHLDLCRLAEVSRLSPTVLASFAEAAPVMLHLYHPAPSPSTPGVLVRDAETAPLSLD